MAVIHLGQLMKIARHRVVLVSKNELDIAPTPNLLMVENNVQTVLCILKQDHAESPPVQVSFLCLMTVLTAYAIRVPNYVCVIIA